MIKGQSQGSGSLAHFLILVVWVTATFACANAARAAESPEGPNACGCRQDSAGTCYCDRKAKCGCPGECEPKGCEEKRAKQFEKEVDLETKKAEAAARKGRSDTADEERVPAPVRTEPAEVSPRRHPAPPVEARAAKAPAPREQEKPREHRMTTAQRRELTRLLDLYLEEHPEARQRNLEQARADLRGADPRP